MSKPTLEASLPERNENNMYDFLTNLTALSGFYKDGVIKEKSGLGDEEFDAINNSDFKSITLAGILAYANATNSYLDLNTDMD